MRHRTGFKKIWLCCAVFIFALVGGRVEAAKEVKKVAETPEIVATGKKVYEKKCMNCHGKNGDAKAPATSRLYPRPRDFTLGSFRIKNTANGELPTEEDIFNAITIGMPGTSMPGWPKIIPEERWGLVYYIKTFSEEFAKKKEEGKYPPPTIKVGNPIPSSPESIKKGEEIFFELECNMCHGEGGRGDGFLAMELETEKGNRIFPIDLTRKWHFRRGNAPQDIYRAVRIGVEGTPMSSFAEMLDNPGAGEEEADEKASKKTAKEEMSGEERTWHLVNYVLSLSPAEKPKNLGAYKVKLIEEALPDDPDDKRWEEVSLSEYPMGGQIIIKPRMFTPMIDFVQLKALYNHDEIAFLLIWHDLSEMTKTDPDEGYFADAVAIQFPQNLEGQKPFFLNGDSENPTYLLHWSADKDGITEMNATGMDRVTVRDAGKQSAKGVVSYNNGEYRLLIKRPLTTGDQKDFQFEPGKFIPIAFSAWEGSNGETGAKRSISAWYYVILEAPISQKVYYYPLLAIFGVAVVEALIIRRVRKKEVNHG